MPSKAEREGSGAPECQRREIKIPRKRACRGFYFSRPIRATNVFLSAIRAYLGNPWLKFILLQLFAFKNLVLRHFQWEERKNIG
jgi:hypothetical protein